jgi:F0F1-type ATP synthase assembly protein I
MKDWRGIGLLIQLSWLFAFSVLVPLLLGIWLDRTLQRSPLFLLIGAATGIIAGTVGSVRIATRAIAEAERARKGHERKEDDAS